MGKKNFFNGGFSQNFAGFLLSPEFSIKHISAEDREGAFFQKSLLSKKINLKKQPPKTETARPTEEKEALYNLAKKENWRFFPFSGLRGSHFLIVLGEPFRYFAMEKIVGHRFSKNGNPLKKAAYMGNKAFCPV